MVAPGAGFRGVTLYRPKYSRRSKKTSSLQNELIFSPKVCDDRKKKEKVFACQSVGFWSQKKKNPSGVTPRW